MKWWLVVLAACGGTQTDAVDNTVCGMPIGGIAPAQFHVTGRLVMSGANLDGAMVTAVTSDNTALGHATSGTDGTYDVTVDTGGALFDGFLEIRASAAPPHHYYPRAPLAAGVALRDIEIRTDWSTLLAAQGAEPTQAGALAIATDCGGAGRAGETITASPAAPVAYLRTGLGDTTDTTGLALVYDVDSGDVSVGGDDLHAHEVAVDTSWVTVTELAPR